MKRLMSFGIAASLLLSLSPAAFAQDSISANQTDNSFIKVVENTENQDGHVITPFDVQLINPIHHTGKGAFEKTFTMIPENGEDANVFVKNNGSSTVYVEIKKLGSSTSIDTSVSPGSQKTLQIYSQSKNSYSVYIYTQDGSQMDLNISARQF
ncbi:hypothetical protein [Paenibacillus polymyxa]|uniref:Uncharacterized protein n=1 Tax=Paenibacillus polymyxa (strain SC2) TaxID=886882 RepID=E3E4L0_PAEPS|nr:hypothetical protein [Paenibacillus polymyxa]ADO56909.1 hypothetical protein PPSC2_13800 [Paenibacillus polymyxa SC2]WPQ54728.1 hypothetical protein SKN87_14070 [Paenibacillus polymyxa]CCC85645.1 hypothetical protein PPM_2708 [Paenibacillus polymyxa M1]